MNAVSAYYYGDRSISYVDIIDFIIILNELKQQSGKLYNFRLYDMMSD